MFKTIVAVVALVFLFVSPVQADFTFTYKFDTAFSGYVPPAGSTPWLTAKFADTGTNEVTLTLTASNLGGTEFVSNWFFNYTGASNLSIIQIMQFTEDDAPSATNALGVLGRYKADGTGGWFDLTFAFPTEGADRFTNGEYAIFTITGEGLTSEMFLAQSWDSKTGGERSVLYAAAHIQGIPLEGGGTTSAWVTTGTSTTHAPIPAAAWLLSSGLLGLAVIRRRLKK